MGHIKIIVLMLTFLTSICGANTCEKILITYEAVNQSHLAASLQKSFSNFCLLPLPLFHLWYF